MKKNDSLTDKVLRLSDDLGERVKRLSDIRIVHRNKIIKASQKFPGAPVVVAESASTQPNNGLPEGLRRILRQAREQSLGFLSGAVSHYILWRTIRELFDGDWYVASYPDVPRGEKSSWKHYKKFGLWEGRNPNAYFHSEWYLNIYPDVAASGIPAVMHYVNYGAKEQRNPHPEFDAWWYVDQNPKGSKNPLLHYLETGRKQKLATRAPNSQEFTSHTYSMPSPFERRVAISVIVPVYKGLDETRRCLESVLADGVRAPDEVIVVDDCSPDREVSNWLKTLSKTGAVRLIRNERNRGFVASVNIGMREAGTNDVVLLNSDTIVPAGWLGRLEQQAYGRERVGTVTPLSNNATICSYPKISGGDLPPDYSIDQIDSAAKTSNIGVSVTIPTAVGFAMYIRRHCIEDVGFFDEETFGLGYGEENDFCLRAIARGWLNILACDVFVYHQGEVSFGKNSPRKERAFKILKEKYPQYEPALRDYASTNATARAHFKLSAQLFKDCAKPVILLITHDLGGGTERHVQELIRSNSGSCEFVLLRASQQICELTIPSLDGHAKMVFAQHEIDKIVHVLSIFSFTKAHVHHVYGLALDLRLLLKLLDVPFDFTLHDYLPLCPRINMVDPRTGQYCMEAIEAGCNSCIAANPPPLIEARNIFAHRWKYDWLIRDANRVICPSEDSKERLIRYGLDGRFVVIPHENLPGTAVRQTALGSRQTIRVGLIGVLSQHKGLDVVRNTVRESGNENIEFILIGKSYPALKFSRSVKYHETGHYKEEDLLHLISTHDLDVLWFPAVWPETYSYTLSAALESGRPIVAVDMGAFTERLNGRANTCLVRPFADPVEWLDSFHQVTRPDSRIQAADRDVEDAV